MKQTKIFYKPLCLVLFALTSTVFMCKKKPEVKKFTPIETVPPSTKTEITTFVHPAILNTKASLDLIASEINSGNAERTASFQKVLDFINGAKFPTSFPATVIVGSNGATTPSKTQIRSDAELVYAIALRWAATGNAIYAEQAIGILNGWSYSFQNYGLLDNPASPTNANQPDLEASWTMPSFVAAAEIIRHYKVGGKSAGWRDSDIKQFEAFLTIIKTTYIDKTPVYNNNWNVSAGYAKMAIGVFLNNKPVYDSGYEYIKKYLTVVISPDGTIAELCDRKDCVHYQYSLTGFTYAAEIARIQGDNSLYTTGSNLISLGYEFMQRAYNQTTGCNYCSFSSPVFPGTEVANNYYKTNTLKSLRDIRPPYGVPNDNTFLGFTTYTHYNVTF